MELSGVLSLLLGVCVSCLLLVASWRKALARRNLPPGPTPLPFVGNILQLDTKALAKSILKFRDAYGPVFTLQLGSERAVVLCGYAAVKEALVDHGKEFGGRGNMATAARITKGFGMIFTNGERWRQLRRFSLTTLRNFGMGKRSIEERIQEEAQCLVEELGNTRGSPFDPTFLLGSAVSNVICSIVFGSRFDYQDQEFLTLLSCVNQNFRLLSSRWGQLYNAFPTLLAALPGRHNAMFHNADTLKRFVSERMKRHQDSLDPSCPNSYIDCFLLQMDQEKQNPDTEFTTENLVMTTLELFFAGTETVSTTLRYGILLLMKYPEIKEKVHEEIDRVIGRSRLPAIEDRSRMPYTDAVIHEVHRFADVLPMSLPHVTTQDVQFRGYAIPKGNTVIPLLTSVLQDTSQFRNPDDFDPGHFLDGNGHFQKNSAFMPFSAGKRVCLGESLARMEVFLFLTAILQRFTLQPLGDPGALDASPVESGVGNIPHPYELQLLPR
ncbi:cytochrome P450 2C19-like [Malaclemys terrapin pileata]|uniref:cytochrome P450 2C19-like n=1 Tax=Malaclemys terrapin pileata TaxID=2991368 RepID=UPI0023A7DBE8|nr:cytochrome P450 2C19-like [Malaclemys terrapin pileata]